MFFNEPIQSFLLNMGFERQLEIAINHSPCSWSLGYLYLDIVQQALLFDLVIGDTGTSSGSTPDVNPQEGTLGAILSVFSIHKRHLGIGSTPDVNYKLSVLGHH